MKNNQTFMKYILPAIVFMLALVQPAFSQDNDELAKKSFASAQAAFAEGQYKETVEFLKSAETYQGGANSRTLYLKIKALSQMTASDKSNQPALQSACNKFFEITDKATYPQEKYQEITNIMNANKGAATTTIAPATSTKSQEQADYDKAVKLKTKAAYKEFLDQYSYTPLANDIKRRYQELVEDEDEYRDHRRPHSRQ